MACTGKRILPTLESVTDQAVLPIESTDWDTDESQFDLTAEADAGWNDAADQEHALTSLESLARSIEAAVEAGHYDKASLESIFEGLSQHKSDGVLMPSLEAFDFAPDRFLEVSLEGLRQTVRKTLSTILELLVRFWRLLTEFAERIQHSTLLMRGRVEWAIGNVNDVTGRYSKVEEVNAGRLIRLLSTDRFPANTQLRLLENLTTLQHQLINVRRRYIPMVDSMAKEMAKVFERWHASDAKDWLEDLNRIAATYDPVSALTLDEPFRNRVSTRFTSDALMGRPLPGRKTIVIEPAGAAATSVDSKPIERATALQAANVTLSELRDERIEELPEMEVDMMPVMAINSIHSLLNKVTVVLDEIDNTTKDDARRSLRQLTYQLDRLQRSSRTDVPDGTVGIFQAGVAYATALSRWAKEPYLSLLNNTLNVCNNTVRMCNLHVRAYMEAPTAKES